ncbi:MAG: hypothetical protein AB7U61_17410, partial [Methylocystis sp.]
MFIDLRRELAVVVRVAGIGWAVFQYFERRDEIGTPRALALAFGIAVAAGFVSWLIDDRIAGDYWPIED